MINMLAEAVTNDIGKNENVISRHRSSGQLSYQNATARQPPNMTNERKLSGKIASMHRL